MRNKQTTTKQYVCACVCMCMQTNNKYSWERITIYRIFSSSSSCFCKITVTDFHSFLLLYIKHHIFESHTHHWCVCVVCAVYIWRHEWRLMFCVYTELAKSVRVWSISRIEMEFNKNVKRDKFIHIHSINDY